MESKLKAIIDQAAAALDFRVERIQEIAKEASGEVAECKRNLQGLAEFAEELPTKMLEKFSTILVGEMDLLREEANPYVTLQVNGHHQSLYGLGRHHPELKPGKYRAIVFFERID